jgi:hypothetical protein
MYNDFLSFWLEGHKLKLWKTFAESWVDGKLSTHLRSHFGGRLRVNLGHIISRASQHAIMNFENSGRETGTESRQFIASLRMTIP